MNVISNFQLKNSFHLLLYGLEIERLTTYELIEEIFNEIKNKVGKLEIEDIMLIEEQSVISIIL
jgi:bifunctional DNase/RNase